MTASGWALTVSGSRRWADEGTIQGTYQDSYAGFLSVEKKFSDRFSVNLTSFVAPTYRASNSPNTQEAYDIMGKDYNSYWGWQDGEKRNSRIRRTVEPITMLQFYNKLGKSSNWNNTFSYQVGRDGRSRLDWFHSADPNPTYYRKMPSYGLVTADEFMAKSQIDWLSLYNANKENYDIGARYSIVEDVNKDKTFNYVSHFDTKLSDNWKLNLNFNLQKLKSDNFRNLKDLLGAQYANNLDAFGGDRNYDVDNPNTKVYEGDRTQYSYDLFRDSYTFNASTEVDLAKWNVMASVVGGLSQSQRNGHFRNHFYQDNSKGRSAIYNAYDAGIKARVTYKINGKNFIVYNGTFFSLAPTLNEIFINPRVNDFVTPGVDNQLINSNELSYILRGQILKLRLTGYLTDVNNATEISRYFAEGLQLGNTVTSNDAFVAEILSGMSKRYKGLELGADFKVSPTLNIIAVGSYGDYTVQNNPNVYVSIDSDKYARGYESLGKANIKGYKIAE